MKKISVLVFAVLISSPAVSLAKCLIVKDLQGYSTRESASFEFEKDKISGSIVIVIDGEDSEVRPGGLNCNQMGADAILCYSDDNIDSVLEVWTIFGDTVSYIKTRSGHPVLNGTDLFIGTVDSRCD